MKTTIELLEGKRKATMSEALEIVQNKIDFRPVEARLNEWCKYLVSVQLSHRVQESTGTNYRINIKSQDLKAAAGVLDPLYKTLTIQDFGAEIYFNPEKKTFVFFIPFIFHYEYKTGGSNGSDVLTAIYDSMDEQWVFSVRN